MPKPLLCALALLLASSAVAQIAPSNPAQQRAANRRALREAQQANVPYKESHLTVTRQQLKRGSAAGPPGTANTRPDEGKRRAGLKLPSLRRSPKTEPTP
ncbi:hypothetical protein HHL22_17325 [Hymenobacter sp. RP-2-7]|uniref:DUF4148 domain-containing protein n=1 Tax=Hymenobacter polaris TaxID=2682546 RepID=A0A7Y0AGN1_9BACT|nr:hypothetical protein [Hymenobacter polaris]NML66970.1 hypothetical protein [Hymenobacter polaris]